MLVIDASDSMHGAPIDDALAAARAVRRASAIRSQPLAVIMLQRPGDGAAAVHHRRRRDRRRARRRPEARARARTSYDAAAPGLSTDRRRAHAVGLGRRPLRRRRHRQQRDAGQARRHRSRRARAHLHGRPAVALLPAAAAAAARRAPPAARTPRPSSADQLPRIYDAPGRQLCQPVPARLPLAAAGGRDRATCGVTVDGVAGWRQSGYQTPALSTSAPARPSSTVPRSRTSSTRGRRTAGRPVVGGCLVAFALISDLPAAQPRAAPAGGRLRRRRPRLERRTARGDHGRHLRGHRAGAGRHPLVGPVQRGPRDRAAIADAGPGARARAHGAGVLLSALLVLAFDSADPGCSLIPLLSALIVRVADPARADRAGAFELRRASCRTTCRCWPRRCGPGTAWSARSR